MKIRELRIENFRKFRRPLHLTGFGDGLNLVCEQNEAGKSTVLEALRAVLFERHGSRSDRIRSFRPHGDEVAPTIELEFDLSGESWRVRKRFLQIPSVELEGPVGRATGDEAEERLQSLLGFARAGNRGADEDSRGALGLLWVEQGQSFVLGAPGQGARRTLENVLAGEVGAVTGGQRTNAVLKSIELSLAEYRTPTGKPTRRLLAAQEAAAAASREALDAKAELEHFDSVLERLEAKRNEQRRLISELDDPEQAQRLARLEEDLDRAKTAGEALRTAEALLRERAGERARLEARETARSELRAQLAKAQLAAEHANAAVKDHDPILKAARETEKEATAALEKARAALRTAEEERMAVQRGHATEARQRALAAAFLRLDKAEAIHSKLKAHRDELAANRMTTEALDELLKLEQAVSEARAAASAGAAVLSVELLSSAPAARLNGLAIEGKLSVPVSEPKSLELEGIGTVSVMPPASGEAAQARLRAAEQDLGAFLAEVGYDTPLAAKEAAEAYRESEQEAARLAAQLEATCPEDAALGIAAGLEALRGTLASETRPGAIAAQKDSDDYAESIEDAWQSARAAEREAEGRRQAALEALQEAQITKVKLNSEVERAAAEVSRLSEQLTADLDTMGDEALADALKAAKANEARAILARDDAQRAVEGLDEGTLRQRLEALRKRRERLLEDRLGLVSEIAQLEERAKTLGGSGPASRAATAAELAEAAAATHDRLREEAEMLTLLAETIRDAQRETSRRFLAPITERVAPFIARLLPSASVVFGEDMRPTLLSRGGREESTDDLSKGTQEQLAVLTRLAFADLLIEKGKPASVVLDDALVFADDDRFEAMLDILSEAAERMQIIILSCRTSAYRGLNAHRILLG